jgi:UDP-N-acetylglucosamine 2-epimerase (non-hydrolysing)
MRMNDAGTTDKGRPARPPGEILLVAAARPNFMKVAPITWELRRRGLPFSLVHTGQHYDANMSDVFFRDLEMPAADEHLGVGSGTHAEQTARVMLAFEPVLLRRKPRWVVVVGDVNSTMAATLTAVKLHVPTAHVEAGLRSRDWAMPEEINRVITDRVADLLLTPSEDGDENLRAEGVPAERIVRVGNVMIDCLRRCLPAATARGVPASLGLSPGGYAVMTLHRPSNVDDGPTLAGILEAVDAIGRRLPVVLPVHPRTRARLESLGLSGRAQGVHGLRLIEPLGYVDFLGLTAGSALVLTDSGGLQEESSVLGIPCLTLRENTERPITVSLGTNRVVGVAPEAIRRAAAEALDRRPAAREIPLWDGRAAGRIVDALVGCS